ncbi:MAG: cytochrome c [Bacteroidota bacterium]|nr:cytochrome c [Bacteroidota bacterium]MDP4234620.1 cytochrome c [Bacteroidota bacterium]MDP4243781.1 cytochrome c [Bacteroidota bacterium]MDP4288981.1 cytochrome c [Bacteroidota bacterium]
MDNKQTMRLWYRLQGVVILFATASTLISCRQDMQDQPKYKAFRGSEIFPDSLSSRNLVQGTVARGYLREDEAYYTGKTAASSTPATAKDTGAKSQMAMVNEFPFPITREILDHGQERFNIFCSPCHGVLGDGRGFIVLRGFRQPPTYHQDRLRNETLGHFFDVITNGFGVMPDYAMQIPPHERWEIIAYIRALQYSQNAKLADLPPDQVKNLK